MNSETDAKLKKIKLVITDVDGVLTDGGMYYNEKGEYMKKFNTRDSMGMELLLQNEIKTIFMTRENSQIVKERAKKIQIVDLYLDVQEKEKTIPEILKKYDVTEDEIAYIGDDVNDLEIMKIVGFSASPNDGTNIVKKTADYTCEKDGGKGVFREVAELIIDNKRN